MYNPPFINLEHVYQKIYTFVTDFNTTGIKDSYLDTFPVLLIFSSITTVFLLAIIFYLANKIGFIRKEQIKVLDAVESSYDTTREVNQKWMTVLSHLDSANPSDWRLAIIEADIMLGDMLDAQGYIGQSIGDQLKQIERSDFLTLNDAWEAHKARNNIAHMGSEYQISEREAKRIISLYQKVFDEFQFI